MKRRIVAVVDRDPDNPKGPGRTRRLYVRADTAHAIRTLAREQGFTIDRALQAMLVDYVPRQCPDLRMIFHNDDADADPSAGRHKGKMVKVARVIKTKRRRK